MVMVKNTLLSKTMVLTITNSSNMDGNDAWLILVTVDMVNTVNNSY